MNRTVLVAALLGVVPGFAGTQQTPGNPKDTCHKFSEPDSPSAVQLIIDGENVTDNDKMKQAYPGKADTSLEGVLQLSGSGTPSTVSGWKEHFDGSVVAKAASSHDVSVGRTLTHSLSWQPNLPLGEDCCHTASAEALMFLRLQRYFSIQFPAGSAD